MYESYGIYVKNINLFLLLGLKWWFSCSILWFIVFVIVIFVLSLYRKENIFFVW